MTGPMLVGFACVTCDRPVEAVLASAETDRVGASWMSAQSHAAHYGHMPARLRFKIVPVGWPEGD
jgi:hypothetical protein